MAEDYPVKPILDQVNQAVINQLAAHGGPPIYTLTPEEARSVLLRAQSGSVRKPDAEVKDWKVNSGPYLGCFRSHIFHPRSRARPFLWWRGYSSRPAPRLEPFQRDPLPLLFRRDGYVDDPTSTTVPGWMVRNASMQAGKCGSKSTTRFERARTISSAILRPVRFC